MNKHLNTKFNSREWRGVDKDNIYVVFDILGFKKVADVMQLRVFDLLNLNRINNNRAEEMLLCIYRFLYANKKLDDGIYFVPPAYRHIRKHRIILSGGLIRWLPKGRNAISATIWVGIISFMKGVLPQRIRGYRNDE